MNKRESVLSTLDSNQSTPYIPAAFFLHFDKNHHHGQSAINKHLEYFHYTGMDFVKIQYELSFPSQNEIQEPRDWKKVKFYRDDFYKDQWGIVDGLVKSAGRDALVIMTLYSPFMCAGQIVNKDLLVQHINTDPDPVIQGLEAITESLLIFVKGCIERGIDGFYHSTQGGETIRFGGSPSFSDCIKPYDLILMEEINQSTEFNILHICDYHGGYSDLTPFLDYPGDIINCSLKLGSEMISRKDISMLFNRPFMGGLDRKGILVSGEGTEIKDEIASVIGPNPGKFILGADCTLPGDMDWEKIKTAISYAHTFVQK